MDNEKDHMCQIMSYEFRKGKTVDAATKDIREVFLDRAPAFRTVKKWFAKFRSGDFNLKDQPRSGRPSELDDEVDCIRCRYCCVLNWEIMPHSPYSPDIAPSDYHLFRSLQNNLNRKNLKMWKNQLDTFFNEKPRDFYESGFRKLKKNG
ncbi:unnamed protein product [Ceratitis capitata]|uniref:(Mediterranean fruit fly) hypothetical protein n=1 Tax=Ceratitis capitata TaxID=7213 RepID=A0A811UFA4_CERCA|nr:unnamed protein product [Ceratitis capitata]